MCLGTPGQILSFEDPSGHTARVDFCGTERSVNTAMVAGDEDPPGPGDWVMVHMGIALHRMDPTEVDANKSFFDDLLAEFEIAAEARDASLEAGRLSGQG